MEENNMHKEISDIVLEYSKKIEIAKNKQYVAMIDEWAKGIEIDIRCPRCSGNNFTLDKGIETKYVTDVLWCLTNRGKRNLCMGKVAYCKKCEKWYPETKFGKHANVYECKECGTVQWHYTDITNKQNEDAEDLRRIERQFGLR